ncbi:MAG: hypothetical protein ACR2GR_07040 [Rhodothermales bacterium]
MKRLFAASVFALSLFVATGCETELDTPGEVSLETRNAADVLPLDVRALGMVDFQALERNPALREAGLFSPGRLGDEMQARLRDFTEATGFRPEEDLREVYIALRGEGDLTRPVFVAYADYTRERLGAYLDEEMSDAFTRADYKGVPVFQSPPDGGGESITVALANDNMFVASPDAAEVHAMLDRLSGEGQALRDDEATMRLIRQASAGSAWFVVRGVDRAPFTSVRGTGEVGEIGEIAQLSRAVQDVAFSLDVQTDGVNADAWMVAASNITPGDLASLTRGAVAAFKTGADLGSEEMAVLDDVRVREAGGEVRVSFRVPNDLLPPKNE